MNDEDIERVLKSAGSREKPPVEVERFVRDRLHADWHSMVAGDRRQGRRRAAFALAAGVLAAAIGIWVGASRPAGPENIVATMTLAAGEVRIKSGWLGGWRTVADGQSLAEGQTLETGVAGRGAIELPGGISARLDHDTRLTIAGTDELTLDRGALYVDAGPDASQESRLDVVTPSGSVRHVGTQYEVRLIGSGVRLRVREGRVEWRSRSGGVAQSQGGEQLTIAGDGRVERLTTPVYGESWDWAAATAPRIDIEGLPLGRFLSWVGRELGREVAYASPETATEVADIVVHGSIAGLTPEQALEAVLTTTSVRAAITDGRIVVGGQEAAAAPAD